MYAAMSKLTFAHFVTVLKEFTFEYVTSYNIGFKKNVVI